MLGPNNAEMRYYNYGGRDFLLLHGIPFYKSTGQNSKSAGTWFPFGGVADDGMMIKPGTEKSRHKKNNPRDNHLGTLMEDLKGIDPAIVQNIAGLFNPGEFALRFFGIQHLLYSTLFGGGVWDLPEGQALKNELQKHFPDFYQKNSPITLNKHPEEYFIVHHDVRDTAKNINKQLKINPNEYVVPNPHPNEKVEVKKDHDKKKIDPPKGAVKPVQHAFAKDKVANKPKGDNKNKDKKPKAGAGHKAKDHNKPKGKADQKKHHDKKKYGPKK